MPSKLLTVMEAIGRDALKALTWVEQYLPKVEELAGLIFPAQVALLTPVINTTNLILKAVTLAEQKMAAGSAQTGTGIQKSADVLSTIEPTVIQLLSQAGLSNVDRTYIQKIIDAVVADLNVREASVPVAPAPATA